MGRGGDGGGVERGEGEGRRPFDRDTIIVR